VYVSEYTLYKNHVNQLKTGRSKTTCLVASNLGDGGRGRVCLRLSISSLSSRISLNLINLTDLLLDSWLIDLLIDCVVGWLANWFAD
jgi:hypothetical protein